jgi:hypothetical protein
MRRWLSSINWLALLATVLMVAAMLFPWWTLAFEGNVPTDIYPYLIDGPASEFIGYKRSKQMTILTYALSAAIGLTLLGSLLRGRAGRLSLFVGALASGYGAYRLVARISLVADRYGIPLQGSAITYEEFAPTRVEGTIRPGIPLMAAGAAVCLLAAVLHNKARLRSSG